MQDLKNIIESLLFVTDEPLSMDKLKSAFESIDGKEIRQALQLLCEEYEQRGGGFYLKEVAGGWQLRSRPEYNEWIRRLLQPSPQRLSKAALETLAVIAYKQPIIRADIEFIRGVDCGGVLRQLMERKLIRVLGRKEIAGRPLIYATTKLFLELFDLKDLKDLPSPKEIAELTNDLSLVSDHTAQSHAAASEPPPGKEPEDAPDNEIEDTEAIPDQVSDTQPDIQSGQADFHEDFENPGNEPESDDNARDLDENEQGRDKEDVKDLPLPEEIAESASEKLPGSDHADESPAPVPETLLENEQEDTSNDITEDTKVIVDPALDTQPDIQSGQAEQVDSPAGIENPDSEPDLDGNEQNLNESVEDSHDPTIQSNNT